MGTGQNGRLSAHFLRREFACPCCGRADAAQELIDGLETLRRRAGNVPIRVTSGYRCPRYNRQIGGARNSYHTQGLAADVVISGQDVLGMYRLACEVPAFFHGGIGLYSNGFVHLDVRGHRARWGRIEGRYCSLKDALFWLDAAPDSL